MMEAQAAGLPCVVSEGVPVECAKTSLVEHISLEEPPVVWAAQILNKAGNARADTTEALINSGYDIEANAKWLQKYYLEKWKKVM
jgi:hypothetical protein